MTTATSPPGGNPARKRRSTKLRRRKVTTITGFAPGDHLRAAWDTAKREWELLIESDNGLCVTHKLVDMG